MMLGLRPKPEPGPKPPYENAPMRRETATDIAIDLGNFLDGAARVEVRPRGEGYDLLIPAECVAAAMRKALASRR